MMQAERDDDGTKVEGLKVPPTTLTIMVVAWWGNLLNRR